MSKTLKILLTLLVLAVLVWGVIFIRGKKSAETKSTGLTTSASSGEVLTTGVVGGTRTSDRVNELVILLRSVSSIELDTRVFENPVFLTLRDMSTQLRQYGDPGRLNPFIPIGFDGTTLGSSSNQQVSNNQIQGQIDLSEGNTDDSEDESPEIEEDSTSSELEPGVGQVIPEEQDDLEIFLQNF